MTDKVLPFTDNKAARMALRYDRLAKAARRRRDHQAARSYEALAAMWEARI